MNKIKHFLFIEFDDRAIDITCSIDKKMKAVYLSDFKLLYFHDNFY